MSVNTDTPAAAVAPTGRRLKVAVVVYAEVSRERARVYRALLTALELLEAGDDVTVIFDGAGTETLAAISDPGHRYHSLAESLRGVIGGACGSSARMLGVADDVLAAGYPLLTDYRDHAGLRKLLLAGYQVLSL